MFMTAVEKETYWQRLKRFREERGLSRGQVARAAELSESYIFRLEKGSVKTPSYWVMKALADAVGVSVEELAEGNVEANGAGYETEEQLSERLARAWHRPGLKHADMLVALRAFPHLPDDDLQLYIQLLLRWEKEAQEKKTEEAHAD